VRRRTIFIASGAVIAFLVIFGTLVSVYTDLLWFRETGYTSVFWTQIRTKAGLGLVFGAIFAAAVLLNLWVVQKITSPYRLFTMQDQILERYRATLRPYVRWAALGMSLLFGLFAGSGATSQWRNWLLFRNAESFGTTDPIFHKDLGFFVFRLPFNRFVFTWSFSSLLVIIIVVGFAHYFMGGIRAAPAGERVAPQVKAHLSVLFGLLVLLKAWGYRLDQFDLLHSPRGTVTGASYTDVNAQLPALRLLFVIAIVCGLLFLVNIRFRGWVLPAAGIGLLALTSIVAGGIYPAAVQRLRVTPVEREREAPFIKRNIDATRAAFRIDDDTVTVRTLPADARLDAKMLAANRQTVENIRLWSPRVLVQTYTALQRITNYYEFLDVDVDRYEIGGSKRQVMLSAREVFPQGLSADARTWVNNHLVYTHGFGAVASRVDRVTPEGQPSFIINDIPARSVPGAPEIGQPRVYFGEEEAEQRFVVVNTGVTELDFPKGQTSFESNKYDGKGGVPLSSVLRRAAFAWRFRDVNLLISSAIKGDSRILFRRKIRDRVRQVAPFLQLDRDPYIVIADGRLVWIQDAYTTTVNYPYSQRISLGEVTGGNLAGRANYIRNSVKATVDAMDGTITLYVWDPTDPIIKVWQRVFPSAFKPASAMSADLRSHVRYPEDLFRVQADRYALYHITDPTDFYSKNDVWRLPRDPTAGGEEPFPPYYVLMSLPGEERLQFILMVPFSPFSSQRGQPRQNMTAWMAARSDPGPDYGKLVSFVFGKEKLVFGPEQIQARIDQDPIVRNQLTLLDPTTTRILKGNLLVIPIEEALLYVQPLYLTSATSSLRELKRVVVVTGDIVRIAPTLEEAIAAIFGGAPAPTTPAGPVAAGDVAALVREALQHYQAAQVALRNGDFATYGAELKKMEDALRRADQAAHPSPSPSPTPTR
jgi:hypothetical protein